MSWTRIMVIWFIGLNFSALANGLKPSKGDRALKLTQNYNLNDLNNAVDESLTESLLVLYEPETGAIAYDLTFNKSEKDEQSLRISSTYADVAENVYNDNILARCAAENGEIQVLSTILGELKTCKVESRGGPIELKNWFGDVPFGLVRQEYVDRSRGVFVVTNLIEVTVGQK